MIQDNSNLPPVIDARPLLQDHSVKQVRLRQNLQKVQAQLQPAKRPLSKLIHQPLICLLLEVTARTIARPSGLLGGGALAFFGCVAYILTARSDAISYNFSLYAVLFITGFLLGLIVEFCVFKTRKS